jgi:hypothetical protein
MVLYAMWRAKGTECSGTIYRADLSPRAGTCALTLRKFYPRLSGRFRRERCLTQARTSVGTISWSFSGVV